MNLKVELVRVNKLTNLSAFVVGNYAALSVQLVSYWWGFLLAHDTHSNLIDLECFNALIYLHKELLYINADFLSTAESHSRKRLILYKFDYTCFPQET